MEIVKIIVFLINLSAYTPGQLLPDNYILGAGDEILIISKTTGQSIKTRITPEGDVPLYSMLPLGGENTGVSPQFITSGLIKAAGLTIKMLEDSLAAFSLRNFGKKDTFKVVLLHPRKVALVINGAVISPGIYLLPANYSVADALWAAGGTKGISNFSRITLIKDRDTTFVDLSTYESLKNPEQNLSISGIDEIYVPETETQKGVFIAGDILVPPLSVPASIPILSDSLISTTAPIRIKTRSICVSIDSAIPLKKLLSRLLTVSVEKKIRKGNVFIKRRGRILTPKNPEIEILTGDSIYVLPLFRGILVSGEVIRPGTFVPLSEGASLEYYIARAGGKTRLAGAVEIVRGFRIFKAHTATIPQDGDIIIVKYSKFRRLAEYIAVMQGILTLFTLYHAYK